MPIDRRYRRKSPSDTGRQGRTTRSQRATGSPSSIGHRNQPKPAGDNTVVIGIVVVLALCGVGAYIANQPSSGSPGKHAESAAVADRHAERSDPAPTVPKAPATPSLEDQARQLDRDGKKSEAAELYRRASEEADKAGDGKNAVRLSLLSNELSKVASTDERHRSSPERADGPRAAPPTQTPAMTRRQVACPQCSGTGTGRIATYQQLHPGVFNRMSSALRAAEEGNNAALAFTGTEGAHSAFVMPSDQWKVYEMNGAYRVVKGLKQSECSHCGGTGRVTE